MAKHSNSSPNWSARRSIRTAVLGAVTAAFLAAPAVAQIPDSERGRALYENHCIACHTAQVHSRPNRTALTREEVRKIVDHWSRQQNLRWSEQETADVVEFLGRTRYHFPLANERISQH